MVFAYFICAVLLYGDVFRYVKVFLRYLRGFIRVLRWFYMDLTLVWEKRLQYNWKEWYTIGNTLRKLHSLSERFWFDVLYKKSQFFSFSRTAGRRTLQTDRQTPRPASQDFILTIWCRGKQLCLIRISNMSEISGSVSLERICRSTQGTNLCVVWKKALSERSEFDFFSYALSKGMYLWYFWILEPDTESGYFMACKDSSLNTIFSSAPTF